MFRKTEASLVGSVEVQMPGPCPDFASECWVTSDQSISEKSLMRLITWPFVSYEVKVSFRGIVNRPGLRNQGIYMSSFTTLIKHHLT